MVICSSEMSSYETFQKESCVDARTCGGVGVHGDQRPEVRDSPTPALTRQGWRDNRLLPACAGVRKPR